MAKIAWIMVSGPAARIEQGQIEVFTDPKELVKFLNREAFQDKKGLVAPIEITDIPDNATCFDLPVNCGGKPVMEQYTIFCREVYEEE